MVELTVVISQKPEAVSSPPLPSFRGRGGKKPRIVLSTELPEMDEGYSHEWLGPFIPNPPALVLCSGESSAGKTVLGYNIASGFAAGGNVLGYEIDVPTCVVYVDLETPPELSKSMARQVGVHTNLGFMSDFEDKLNSNFGYNAFLAICRDFNPGILIIDPLSMAYPVEDENNNSEADRQMQRMKQLAVNLNCVVFAMWNMGTAHVKDTFKARGATARIDRTDIALNYTRLANGNRRLQVVKSRYSNPGASVELRDAGGLKFEVVKYRDGNEAVNESTQIQEAIDVIMAIPNDGEILRRECIESVGSERLADKAIKSLRDQKLLENIRPGAYRLHVKSEGR